MSALRPEEQADVDALDRILTRMAMTDEEKFGGVLAKLLPALLKKLTPTDTPTRRKVSDPPSSVGLTRHTRA